MIVADWFTHWVWLGDLSLPLALGNSLAYPSCGDNTAFYYFRILLVLSLRYSRDEIRYVDFGENKTQKEDKKDLKSHWTRGRSEIPVEHILDFYQHSAKINDAVNGLGQEAHFSTNQRASCPTTWRRHSHSACTILSYPTCCKYNSQA